MTRLRERRIAGSGRRWVAAGTPILVVGIVLALLLDGAGIGLGVVIALIGGIPVVVGLTLLGGAGVERRSRRRRPFA